MIRGSWFVSCWVGCLFGLVYAGLFLFSFSGVVLDCFRLASVVVVLFCFFTRFIFAYLFCVNPPLKVLFACWGRCIWTAARSDHRVATAV